MEKILDHYLEKIERHLKPLPVSERVDIVKEIKSEMLALLDAGKTSEEIMNRLGEPKDLAKAYLGDVIQKEKTITTTKVLAMMAYYSLTSLSGIVVIPTFIVCAPVFIICGAVCPILGVIKMLDSLLKLGIPFAENIVVAGIENPFLAFLLCVAVGLGLILAGCACWKLLLGYFKLVSKTRDRLSI